jgi:hypothetical protein
VQRGEQAPARLLFQARAQAGVRIAAKSNLSTAAPAAGARPYKNAATPARSNR